MSEGKIIEIDEKRNMIRVQFSSTKSEWFRKTDCAELKDDGIVFGAWEPKID